MAKVKRFRTMTPEEKAAATKMYEAPGFVPTPSPVHPKVAAAERRVRAAIKRGPGRPTVGEGAERVMVSLEGGLLTNANEFAEAHDVSRSEVIAAGLRLAIAMQITSMKEVAIALATLKASGVLRQVREAAGKKPG